MKTEIALQHGNQWCGENLAGWIASLKCDGHRATWTGSQLLTRAGNAYNPPAWFISGLPKDTPLDCELWLGLNTNHNDVARAVRAGNWRALRLAVFDVPRTGLTVENAIALIQSLRLPKHVKPVEFITVESNHAALTLLRSITQQGGEGIMLRRPGSAYLPYRNSNLLKLKETPL